MKPTDLAAAIAPHIPPQLRFDADRLAAAYGRMRRLAARIGADDAADTERDEFSAAVASFNRLNLEFSARHRVSLDLDDLAAIYDVMKKESH